MNFPLFNDVIMDPNVESFVSEIQTKPVVPESPAPEVADDMPPEFREAARMEAEQTAVDMPPAGDLSPMDEDPMPVEKPVLDYNEQADLIVGVADSVQQIAFSAIGKRKMFTSAERQQIRDIIKKKRKNKELTEEEQKLLDEWHEFKDFEADLPFEEKEAEMIRKPLARVLEMQSANFDPRTALVLACAMVTAPRVLSLKELERK